MGPRDTHIMLVGHPPLLHVQHLHLHDAAPRRHGRCSAGPSAGAGGAGQEPGAERDPGPGPSTRRRCCRRRPPLRAPSCPARQASAPRPAPGPPPEPRPARLKGPGPHPGTAAARLAHVRPPPGLCPRA